MEVLRRNTDYALRAAVFLAKRGDGEFVSAREISDEESVPYSLACKLMQKLHDAGIVESTSGLRGGYRLARRPGEVAVQEVIAAVQGPIRMNMCLNDGYPCANRPSCSVHRFLAEIQGRVDEYLNGTTLGDLLDQWQPITDK